MEKIVTNLGSVRREVLDGKAYLVAPVTMIVPGVLNGSQGAIFYSPEELKRSVANWNGLPIVVEHPSDGGSARRPEVLAKQGVGKVFNAQIKDNKLVAEAFFDTDQALQTNPRILFNLGARRKMELSTGLQGDIEKIEEQQYNGVTYQSVIKNLRPDHLAVLLESEGACSLKDGCGVLNKNGSHKETSKMDPEEKKAMVDTLIANHCCWDEEDREVLNAMSDEKLKSFSDELDKQQQREAVHNAAIKGFTDPGGSSHVFNEKEKKWETKTPKEKDEKTPSKTDPVQNQQAVLTDEQKEDLEWARAEKEKQRTTAIGVITANKENKLTEEQLAAMSLSVLQNVAASLPKKEETKVLNFAGAAGASQSQKDKPKPLGIPKREYPSLSAAK